MHLTSLYTIEQLNKALLNKYGPESLIKTVESVNDDKEEVITVTIAKKMKD